MKDSLRARSDHLAAMASIARNRFVRRRHAPVGMTGLRRREWTRAPGCRPDPPPRRRSASDRPGGRGGAAGPRPRRSDRHPRSGVRTTTAPTAARSSPPRAGCALPNGVSHGCAGRRASTAPSSANSPSGRMIVARNATTTRPQQQAQPGAHQAGDDLHQHTAHRDRPGEPPRLVGDVGRGERQRRGADQRHRPRR